jgi:methyl-accepting chemotaxis protein
MLETLVPNIQRTADLVQEISAATREQNIGAEQINQAIRDLDQVIRQNAEDARRAAETTGGLAGSADEMRRIVDGFTLQAGDADRQVALVVDNPDAAPRELADMVDETRMIA